ncbi:hypothetical protein [Agrobacterium tumefaciens]|nr:hypothetical protein [Agrobacterium tumefaciens]MBP2540429.1 hypothetical protein [Agrobacterium tumefaciens]MDP9788739.1 hypothetical protein [Agrobacterium tumefaciens]
MPIVSHVNAPKLFDLHEACNHALNCGWRFAIEQIARSARM